MSKADGKLIKLTFTEKITTADVSGMTPTPLGGIPWQSGLLLGVCSVGSYYLSNYGTYLTDGLTSPYWMATSSTYIKFRLRTSKAVQKMRWYTNTSYYPKDFTISGSNDDSTYTDIASLTSASYSGWQEFSFSNVTNYKYYKITITSFQTFIQVYEVQLAWPVGAESAFSLSGFEYTYVPEGELVAKTYSIDTISVYPGDEYSILLTIFETNRFESQVGNLTLVYDADVGNLAGIGGKVASFSVPFAPSDLIPKPNVNDPEHVEISDIVASSQFVVVTYHSTRVEDSHVEIASISASGILTNIDDL